MDWLPIDTAPTDGTEILASDYDAIEIASWVKPRFDVGITGYWTNRDGKTMYPAWWQPLPDHPPMPAAEPPAITSDARIDRILDEFTKGATCHRGHSIRHGLARARAALATEPKGPADEELLALFGQFDIDGMADVTKGMPLDTFWDDYQPREAVKYARAVLARWGRPAPQPVPVSERLPGPEDCDAEGRCWFSVEGNRWAFEDRTYGSNWQWTHWLPAHALPLPTN